MITGKSTHNQRIERLWRDVYEGVLGFYYDLFYFMEDNQILDPLSDVHLAALHFIYLPKINEKLKYGKMPGLAIAFAPSGLVHFGCGWLDRCKTLGQMSQCWI